MAKSLKISIPSNVETSKSSTAINKLEFGSQKVLISKDELKKLNAVYRKYVEDYGVEIGFVNYLLSMN